MTDKKKTEELNEAELDQITGGAGIGDIKPGLTEKTGVRANEGDGFITFGAEATTLKPKSKGFLSAGSGTPTV